jgi:serine/threonine protein kinase
MTQIPQDPTLIDGRYRLVMELGAGAFGKVHKAVQVVFGHDLREVALKVFSGQAVTPENVQTQMNDAIQVIALLSRLADWEIRQHFVTIYDLGVTAEASPRGYVAMELVCGGSLEKRIHDFQRFTLQGVFHYLLQIARAMAFMHDEGFVHSDLKPANILIFRGREHDLIKIGDFGLSGKYLGPLSGGPAGGTMSYMAAECLVGLATTPAADVFSMGLIAYEMLTGRNPLEDVGSQLDPESPTYHDDLRAMQIQARQEPLPLREEDLPELAADEKLRSLLPVLDVIRKMIAPDVRARYSSAKKVYADLQQIAAGRTPEGETVVEPDPAEAACQRARYGLSKGEWGRAGRDAAEAVRLAPRRAAGYLLRGEVFVQQAQRCPAALAATFWKQAIEHLVKGLSACDGPAEQQQLRTQVADVYQRMGDTKMADEYRRMNSASPTERPR